VQHGCGALKHASPQSVDLERRDRARGHLHEKRRLGRDDGESSRVERRAEVGLELDAAAVG
jgi:hypothetical protein